MNRRLFVVPLALLFTVQCGYRLSGRGQNLPPASRTIAIPEFRNSTARFQAEDFVSNAVRQEFLRRSRLQLVESTSAADLLLEGNIVSFDVTPVAYTQTASAYSFRVSVVLDVRLVDMRSGQLVFEESDLSFSDTYETAESVDFFSQETDVLEEIAGKLAASVVATILENF